MASSSMRALASVVSLNRLKNLGPLGSSERSVDLIFPSPSRSMTSIAGVLLRGGRRSLFGPIAPAQDPLDPSAAQHARPGGGVGVEHAGLTGCDTVFAVA